MARTYNVQELIDRCRLLTDTVNNKSITDLDIMSMLDHAYPRTWTILFETSQPEHVISSTTFNTVAGQLAYSLSAVILTGDFWKVRNVYVNEGNGQYRPLHIIHEQNIQAFRPPQGAYSIKLDYIPNAPKLTSLSQSIDGINGWEEHMVALACQDIKTRKKEDPNMFIKKQQEVERDMKKFGYRDAGQAERVVRRKSTDPYLIYRNNVDGYRLRGDNLELYYRAGYYAVP